MNPGVIVDTCVWIAFFRSAVDPLSKQVHQLLRSGSIAMVGMVLAEILQGIKSEKEARLVNERLNSLPYVEATRSTWEKAGTISGALRRNGITLPLSDLIIGALAIENGLAVFTIDPHFDQIPGCRRHLPAA